VCLERGEVLSRVIDLQTIDLTCILDKGIGTEESLSESAEGSLIEVKAGEKVHRSIPCFEMRKRLRYKNEIETERKRERG
jgi:hypothetical protein